MQLVKETTLLAIAMTGVFGNSMVALADNTSGKSFEGVIVEDVIVIDQFPTEVHSGSIKISDDSKQAMASLTIISSSGAAAIAARAVPGKIVETKLENEENYLVWEVETIDSKGREIELMIDAGNGRLLAVENEEEEDHWNWKFWEDNEEK